MHTLLFALGLAALASGVWFLAGRPFHGSRSFRISARLFLLSLLPFGGLTISTVVFLMVGRECFEHSATWDKMASLAVSASLIVLASVQVTRALRRHAELRNLVECLPEARLAALDRAAAGLPVRVVASAKPIACLVGWSRPTVLVSSSLLDLLDAVEIEAVVAHERAHHARGDGLVVWLANFLARLAPVSAADRLRADILDEIEVAADELAARQTRRPAALASALLKVWQSGPSRGMPSWSGALAIPFAARQAHLETRIARLLDPVPEPPAGAVRDMRAALLASAAAAVLVVATLGVLPFVAMTRDHADLCDVRALLAPDSHEHEKGTSASGHAER